ncbi:MAG: DegV family protein [Dehalococcoidia bacterium]|jgi:DegV family protein with EDD domain|nr:DegV family protein [Dehalococcoidia bacterium]
MNDIAVATDSVACLPEALATQHAIRVIPVRVTVGDSVYEDSVDDLPPDVVRRLQSEPLIDTTPWPPEHYYRIYLELARTAGCILHVAAFSRFTSTSELARVGAAMAQAKLQGLRVELLDSASTGMGQGFVALAAAREVARGGDFQAVVEVAERVRASARSVFALESLGYLARTGRVGRLYGWASSMLKVTPVVGLYAGAEHPIALVRSPAQAARRLLAFVEQHAPQGARLHVAIMDSGRPGEAAELARVLRNRPHVVECHTVSFTPVMQLVAGPGVLGVAFYPEQ